MGWLYVLVQYYNHTEREMFYVTVSRVFQILFAHCFGFACQVDRWVTNPVHAGL